MKIRAKTLSVIAFSLLTTALANFFVLKTLVFPTFLALEQQAAARDIQRVIEAINSETEDVDKTLWDYSSWDDSYRYAKGGYKTYPDGNLAIETLRNLRLDVVEVYDARRTKLFAVVYDRRQDRIRRAPWTLAHLDQNDQVLARVGEGENVVGMISTPDGAAMFSARPIVKTNGDGPAAGTFIFGRFLDDELIASIKDKIKVDFTLTPVEGLSGPAADAYRQLVDSGKPVLTQEADNDRLIAYSLLRDFRQQPILLATAKARRDISQIGRRVLLASVGGVALTAILVMAVLAVLLQWVLVGPLVKLTQHVVEIGADGALGRRIAIKRRDEIGILGREFDRMLASLAEARDRLLDHSYQSGIAHMASGVLHNLRNQLMPAMTRLERLREQVSERSKQQLDAALDEFGSEQTSPERKARIAAYIALSMQDARDRQRSVVGELSAISRDSGARRRRSRRPRPLQPRPHDDRCDLAPKLHRGDDRDRPLVSRRCGRYPDRSAARGAAAGRGHQLHPQTRSAKPDRQRDRGHRRRRQDGGCNRYRGHGAADRRRRLYRSDRQG